MGSMFDALNQRREGVGKLNLSSGDEVSFLKKAPMKNLNCSTSTCQFCRHYQLEGRRGGTCSQLNAPVRGSWKACSLALPPFAPSWETLEQIWQNNNSSIGKMLPEQPLFSCSKSDIAVEESSLIPDKLPANAALI